MGGESRRWRQTGTDGHTWRQSQSLSSSGHVLLVLLRVSTAHTRQSEYSRIPADHTLHPIAQLYQRYTPRSLALCLHALIIHSPPGVLHDGVPQGSIETIAGVQTYVATPPAGLAGVETGSAVLYLGDVFGFYNNSKVSAVPLQ
jgi:hypothetical protein